MILFFPWPIYFEINASRLSVCGFSMSWPHLEKKGEKVLTNSAKKHLPSKQLLKKAIKGVRLKKLDLCLGYQCEMIDESMYLYAIYLTICPLFYAVLKNHHVKTYMNIQNFPVKKSTIKGMIELCLVKIILECLRRQ